MHDSKIALPKLVHPLYAIPILDIGGFLGCKYAPFRWEAECLEPFCQGRLDAARKRMPDASSASSTSPTKNRTKPNPGANHPATRARGSGDAQCTEGAC